MSLRMSQVQGLSRTWAHLYGLPHIGSTYTDYETGDYRGYEGEPCLMCGRPATNSHHVVWKSVGEVFFVGGRMLRSPLWALCGSGTTGCHSLFHGGARFRVRWEWNSDDEERAWWSGELLDRYGPHDDRLFRHGRYVVEDRLNDMEIAIGMEG